MCATARVLNFAGILVMPLYDDTENIVKYNLVTDTDMQKLPVCDVRVNRAKIVLHIDGEDVRHGFALVFDFCQCHVLADLWPKPK